ncbi:HAD-IA family hydrolase [Mucilaginibacter sp. PAMB04274]|uniref:HAD family hydrolase n=1 Tax=Mucilaginibacter sp. PAMB04274 TaxID=3138568 RepID=UPI0031F62088
MPAYKHYSFDLWLTLIRSNPLFKKYRSVFFHNHFNFKYIPLEQVEHIFRTVDIMCNGINERTGKNIDAEEMYLMVISLMNENQVNLHDIDLPALYQQMENLVFDYLPQVYCNSTAAVLSNLKMQGFTTNILSNTGFIKGVTLRKVLRELDIDQHFDFQIYSDEAGMSKPNPALFQFMIEQAMAIKPLELANIIHIGDNPRADVAGAQAVGLAARLINSNNETIVNLTHHETPHLFPS